MANIDPEVTNVKKIYQIIVTTDRAYSAIGMSNFLIEAYDKIYSQNELKFIEKTGHFHISHIF